MVNFSIVTINWNNLDGLKDTYQSLVSQTCRNFRWIVIDGVSTDGSVEWLQGLDDKQAEITIEADKGIYDAMNKGRLKAIETPGYTLFLNSGDCLADACVLEQISAAVNRADVEPKFIYGDYYRKNAHGRVTRVSAKPIERVVLGLPSSHQSMYFENERLRTFSFRLDYKLSADYCMLIEFLRGLDRKKAIMRMPVTLCIFDTTGVSQQRRFEAIREDLKIRMRFLDLSLFNAITLYVLHYIHTHTKIVRASLER